MTLSIALPGDVTLVHRFPLDGRNEVHAYVQPHNGVDKAHVRLVSIRKNGSVAYSQRGLALPVSDVTKLLTAVALLTSAVSELGDAANADPVEAWGLEPGDAAA